MPILAPKTKPDWNALVQEFCVADFIYADPIAFPHTYHDSPDWRNMELAAFLSAHFSYGRRDKIRETVGQILEKLGNDPVAHVSGSSPGKLQKTFRGFYYRFNTVHDLVFILQRLGEIYRTDQSLKDLWTTNTSEHPELQHRIHAFRRAFLWGGKSHPKETYGMKFMFADPLQNSAAKRFNMFLRWVVRKDAVDLGLWADIMTPAELIIPLDTHVAAMARKYRITQRKSNDWKTATEITNYFRRLDPTDPVRYDFALFGLGLQEGPYSD